MRNIRIIARLDIKGKNVVNTIQLEGLRVVGEPNKLAIDYYNQGADELLIIDQVASLYQRDQIVDVIKNITKKVFIPITVGGGIRNIDDANKILKAGADKVAINTAAINEQDIVRKLAMEFGKQCVIASIPCKRKANNNWEVFSNGGREKTNLEPVEWAKKLISLGAGELLVTSIDNDGLRKGFDLNLAKKFEEINEVPIVMSGGFSNPKDAVELFNHSYFDGCALADFLHMKKGKIQDIKDKLIANNFTLR